MWSRRAQEYDQKINSGKIYELAEVVKDLNKNTDIIADLSYSERQLFEKAYERLKSEFEAVLKTKPKIKRTMWSRRAQEYDQKINSGKIYELAEVVKDLNKNTDIIADQSYSERQLFEKAYERLKSEFEAVLKISPEDVQKKMDKALGRLNISESSE